MTQKQVRGKSSGVAKKTRETSDSRRATKPKAKPAQPKPAETGTDPVEPDPRRDLRILAAKVDATVEYLRSLDGTRREYRGGSFRVDSAWEGTVYEIAKAAADDAWERLRAGLAEAGYSVLIVGARCYFTNAGRDHVLCDPQTSPAVASIWRHIESVDRVLILDWERQTVAAATPLMKRIHEMACLIGESELVYRAALTGPYRWVKDAIDRYGRDLANDDRLRVVVRCDLTPEPTPGELGLS